MSKERILIMGAGGVGGYFGALLTRSGYHVVFIARGEHLAKMRKQGLLVKTPQEEIRLPKIIATDNPADSPSPDLILFTVKSYDTEKSAGQIMPVMRDNTIVLTIQNGISNYKLLCNLFGESRVVQGFTKISSLIESPGVIKCCSSGVIYLGEPDGKFSERIEKIKSIFDNAMIVNVVSKDIKRDMWKKFIWNCTFNIITTITRSKIDRLFTTPESYSLVRAVIQELVTVAEAEDVQLGESDVHEILNLGEKSRHTITSTLYDLQHGKRLEVDTFTGEVIRIAERHNIPVPINQTLYGLMKTIESENIG